MRTAFAHRAVLGRLALPWSTGLRTCARSTRSSTRSSTTRSRHGGSSQRTAGPFRPAQRCLASADATTAEQAKAIACHGRRCRRRCAPPSSPRTEPRCPMPCPVGWWCVPTSRSIASTTADLRRIGNWLEQLSARWPKRRSMRREVHRRGKRIDVRESMRCVAHDRLGGGAAGSAPARAIGRAGWCWSATSADRCSPTRPSICISCGQRHCARRVFALRSSRSRHR